VESPNTPPSNETPKPPAPTGAPVAMPAPKPASAPASAAAPVKHKLNHSYVWLGALRIVPFVFVVAIASAGDALFELIDIYTTGGSILIVLLALIAIVLVATGIAMLVRFISYNYIWYEYSNEEFSFYSGIISKKRAHVPYQRIQSINQKATLFQRIAGVCTVSIETAGGASNTAITLPYIEKSAAEALRKELFARKQFAQMKAAGVEIPAGMTTEHAAETLGTVASQSATSSTLPAPTGAPATTIPAPTVAPTIPSADEYNALDTPAHLVNDFRGVFGGDAIDTGTTTYEYGLSNKQLVLTGMTGKTSVVVVFLSIFATLSSVLSGIGYMFHTSEDEMISTVTGLIDLIPTSWMVGVIVSIVGSFIAIMLVVWLITVGGACLSYGGFRARRRGARIETEYGIINHNFNGIDIDRIQSVEVSQSFFQRLLKSCTLSLARVASAAQDSSESSTKSQARLVIHPFVKLDKVDEILAGLLPEWQDLPAPDKKLPARARRRAILQGGGFWLAIITFITMFLLALPLNFDFLSYSELSDYLIFYTMADVFARVLYGVALLIFIVDIVGAILWHKGSGFGYDSTYVTIENSGISTNRTITPRTKVQMASLQTNPLQRNKQLTTIIAFTAAGVGASTLKLIDAEQDDASAWFSWCHPGGNKTQTAAESSVSSMQ
jgi:putative membrane protein